MVVVHFSSNGSYFLNSVIFFMTIVLVVVLVALRFVDGNVDARCKHVAAAGDHLLVNVSVEDKWTLRPGTLYHMVVGEPELLSEATTGSCAGDERRFSAEVSALLDELDLTSPALRHAKPASALAIISVVIHHITTPEDYRVVQALEANDYGTAVKLVNEDSLGVNARDKLGTTPLMISVVQKQDVLTGTLLNAWQPRVDVNARTPAGFTALHYSVGEGTPGITRALLRRGADPNTQIQQHDSGGWTPLHFACRFGDLDLVALLLEFNADPLAVSFADETVLQVAEDADLPQWKRKKVADIINEAIDNRISRGGLY